MTLTSAITKIRFLPVARRTAAGVVGETVFSVRSTVTGWVVCFGLLAPETVTGVVGEAGCFVAGLVEEPVGRLAPVAGFVQDSA